MSGKCVGWVEGRWTNCEPNSPRISTRESPRSGILSSMACGVSSSAAGLLIVKKVYVRNIIKYTSYCKGSLVFLSCHATSTEMRIHQDYSVSR